MGLQPGFFDLDERYAALSKAGDPLVRLRDVVPFEVFRYRIEKALNRSDRSKGGRPAFDAVFMFKVLVLQALYNLSDDQAEFQIGDRLSFMRFLGMGLSDKAPDAKTIWLFRELLTQAGAIDKLFAVFDARLKEGGYLAMSGQIIDATLVAAPRQRNDDDEKQALREGRIPEDWQANPHKLAQKDRDARWTLKRGRAKKSADGSGKPAVEIAIPVFGYKNHISTDRRHGFIRRWAVSSAAEHDSRRFREVLDTGNTGSEVWADTAYRSRKNEEHMARHGLRSKVHFRRAPGKKLSEPHAKANAARSKVRSAVEHVFAHQKAQMGVFIRTIGIARAKTKIGMVNLAYNMRRLVWWQGRAAPA
jgi:transposase, IS5 family